MYSCDHEVWIIFEEIFYDKQLVLVFELFYL